MQITVKLFASFRTGRFAQQTRELSEGATVAAVAAELGIRDEELGVLAVNGRHVRADHVLRDGDTCSIFPVVGGG